MARRDRVRADACRRAQGSRLRGVPRARFCHRRATPRTGRRAKRRTTRRCSRRSTGCAGRARRRSPRRPRASTIWRAACCWSMPRGCDWLGGSDGARRRGAGRRRGRRGGRVCARSRPRGRGCSWLGALRHVVVELAIPGFAALAGRCRDDPAHSSAGGHAGGTRAGIGDTAPSTRPVTVAGAAGMSLERWQQILREVTGVVGVRGALVRFGRRRPGRGRIGDGGPRHRRCRRAGGGPGRSRKRGPRLPSAGGAPRCVHLTADEGVLLAVAGPAPLWLVAVTDPDAELGRLRLLLGDFAAALG